MQKQDNALTGPLDRKNDRVQDENACSTDGSGPDADAPFTHVRLETIEGRLYATFCDSTDPTTPPVFRVAATGLKNRLHHMKETGYRATLTKRALEMMQQSL